MIFIAFIDAIATQVFISVFPGSFRIALSVAILPVFYYFDEELNPLYTAFFISLIGVLFRIIINVNLLLINPYFILNDLNIIIFDIVYGLIFYFMYFKKESRSFFNWGMIVFFGDLIANSLELISRKVNLFDFLNQLIVIAFFRTVIASVFVIGVYYVLSVLNKEVDRKRYYDLQNVFSDIQSEVYLMNNNIEHIEKVMTDAYILYDDLEKNDKQTNKKQALKIAQNVHEVKKNYLGILSGLSDVEFNKKLYEDMNFYKILEILEKNLGNYIRDKQLPISLNIVRNGDFVVKKHYYIMSIIRNLLNNAIESLENSDLNERSRVTLSYEKNNESVFINIFDNGSGIKEKNIDYIFNSGFSTKFSDDGKIHRGLGLALVKEIIELEFDGSVFVESKKNRYTKFSLELKIDKVVGD